MGNNNTKETGNEKPSNSNGKTVNLLAEICSSWGYGNKKSQLMTFIKELANNGYTINYTIDPKEGGNGEYFVYQVTENSPRIIFSNDKKHENSAIVAEDIIPGKLPEVFQKIINKNWIYE